MKILEESIDEFKTIIINKNTLQYWEIPFNLNTEKLITRIKKSFNDRIKYDNQNKEDLRFEIIYNKNHKQITENFDSVFKLIYRIKTI